MHKRFAPSQGERYLASNVFITLPGEAAPTPFARSHRRFTTKQGRRVLAFGILFDFKFAAAGIHVTLAKDLVRQSWFLEALRKEKVDTVLLVGHAVVSLSD